MLINNIDDVLNVLVELKQNPDLSIIVEQNRKYSVVNINLIDTLTYSSLFENMEVIELNASYFFLDEDGLTDRIAENKLKSKGFTIARLNEDYRPFTHVVTCNEYSIMFSY